MKKFSHYLTLYSIFMFLTALGIFTALTLVGIGNPVPDQDALPVLVAIITLPALYTWLWEWLTAQRPRL